MTPAELAKELKKRSKRWCFTLNNWTEESYQQIVAMIQDTEEETEVSERVEGVTSASVIGLKILTYLIIGKEIGDSGTEHLQGYLELKERMVGGKLRKLLPKGMSLQAAKGTAEENMTYCAKDGEPLVLGTPMKQGARTDLEAIRISIESGVTEKDLASRNFKHWVRYHSAFTKYRQMIIEVKRDWMPEIFIYWGATGLGKTRKVYDDEKGEDIWTWNGNHTFYQGYDMHDVALFDDFYGEINLPYILKLTDRYPMIVNIKNGRCNWQPKKIYFTSNVNPRDWSGWLEYPQAVKNAFFRRVRERGKIVHFVAMDGNEDENTPPVTEQIYSQGYMRR